MGAIYDFVAPYKTSHSGFALIGDGTAANTDAGTWRDYRETVVATAPSFQPAAGTYSSAQGVSISSVKSGAVMHYTLDGSTPTALSPVYNAPLTIGTSSTIKAIAMVAGQTTSPVATATYQINLPQLTAPVFTVPSPYSGVATNVGIISSAAGSQLLYCQDVSNTCTPSVPYISPIRFATSGYLRALSAQSGYAASNIAVWQGSWTAVQITTTSCPEGTQYKPYPGCTITVSGGLPPYVFGWSTASDSSLVEGLQLNALTGVITGTVSGQGVYSVPFTVTDGTNTTVTKNVTMPIRGDNTTEGCSLFPADSIWHLNLSGLPVDTSAAGPISSYYVNSSLHLVFGPNISDGGIPFLRVPYNQPNVPISTNVYQSYFTSAPFPQYAPIEGTLNAGNDSDRHVAVVQTAGGGNHCKLWEMWQGTPTGTGWTASSNAYWDLESYDMLPQDVGSTDAAGLPVTPLLWNYDEVAGGCAQGAECGVVKHPARLTLNHTLNYHVWPATAQSGNGYCLGGYQDSNRLISQSNPPYYCSGGSPMGEMYRMKSSSATPSACVGHPQAQVLVTALRNYGVIITDNGITGGVVATADSRWNADDLACLTAIKLSDFEPVNVSGKMIDINSSKVRP
ncbi:MAG: chitobiase/beta-hexosaminidase C-terminal domain-containing protein [Janthinobacterium lividum]